MRTRCLGRPVRGREPPDELGWVVCVPSTLEARVVEVVVTPAATVVEVVGAAVVVVAPAVAVVVVVVVGAAVVVVVGAAWPANVIGTVVLLPARSPMPMTHVTPALIWAAVGGHGN